VQTLCQGGKIRECWNVTCSDYSSKVGPIAPTEGQKEVKRKIRHEKNEKIGKKKREE
jgi:hypothetical protein